MEEISYKCEAVSRAAFIQQFAISYVQHGYWFYVKGTIPDRKDPIKTDQKIIGQYQIGISKWARARRKQSGKANLQYLRYQNFFVIVATKGRNEFFEKENQVKDIRKTPLKFAGYSIGYRFGQGRFHASVRLELSRYKDLKAYFESRACHLSIDNLMREFQSLKLLGYAPVRWQMFNILRAVNRKRDLMGYEHVPKEAVYFVRYQVKPFEKAAA